MNIFRIKDKVYMALLAVVGLVLCFIPLFNVLGYESAAVFGVFAGFYRVFVRPDGDTPADLLREVARAEVGLVGPLLLLSLNAVRVPNCDFLAGLQFWLFIPCFSVMFGAVLSFLAHNLIHSRWKANVAGASLLLLTAALFGLQLALEPPITGHHLFLGYFSGSIYDEALSIPRSLIYFRVLNILAAAFCLALFFSRRTGSRRALLAMAVAVLVTFAFGWIHREEHGIHVSREYIAERLGGYAETEHFEIYYPAQEPFISDIERIKQDHEFRYSELREYFGTDPVEFRGTKVRSFIYPNRDIKGGLMGGRRTLVAKIWLREIHILWRHYGDHMLAHELAHVFTEPFGNGPLRLSARYGVLGINMGVVEGAATAADWHAPDLDPHQASAALYKLDAAPNLEQILSASGFWTQYSGRVYTLMGSFTQFLVDTYGIETFRDAYTDGDFERAYGVSVTELVQRWRAFIGSVELTEDDLEKARYQYDRKSIFQKVCARKIADLRVRAGQLANNRAIRDANEVYQQIVAFDPKNIDYQIEYAGFLARNNLDAEALSVLETASTLEGSAVHTSQIDALRGDLHWKQDQIGEAKAAYKRCLEHGLPNDFARMMHVKSQSLQASDAERDLVLDYLIRRPTPSIDAYYPTEWVRRNPEHPIANYLLARRLWQNRMWDQAFLHASKAAGHLSVTHLENENRRMLVESSFFSGDLERAKHHATLLSEQHHARYRTLGAEWLRRIAHYTRNTIQPG